MFISQSDLNQMFHYLWTPKKLLELYLENIHYHLVRLCRDSSLDICFKFKKKYNLLGSFIWIVVFLLGTFYFTGNVIFAFKLIEGTLW